MKHLFIVVLSLTWSQLALAQSNESEATKQVIEKGTSTTKSTAFQKGTYMDASKEMTLTFADEGKFVSVMNGLMGVEGSYKVIDNTIEITDTGGPRACKGPTGKYKWTLTDKALTLFEIDDLCVSRIRGLTQKTFTQK